MLKKFCFLTTTLAIVATFGAVAKAETPADQKASPTPTAKPQNQTSSPTPRPAHRPPHPPLDVRSTVTPAPSLTPRPKSPKELKADKGWDGKVQGKHQASPTATPTPAKSR